MTDARRSRGWPLLAWLWAGLVLALLYQQAGFWRDARLDSDVMALLPGESQDPMLKAAAASIGESATRQVVVLIGGRDWPQTRRASEAFLTSLDTGERWLAPLSVEQQALDAALEFYGPQRKALLTPEQRQRLRESDPQALAETALARLFGPGPSGGLTRWQDDPLGLWPEWWQARAGRNASRRDGLMSIEVGDAHWAVLSLESRAPAFQLDGSRRLQDQLDAAAKAAQEAAGAPGLSVLRAGMPLHAEAAAGQASHEVNTIGLGSLLAVLVLVWLAFRSVRPIMLVALSLLIGCAAGVAATALCFGKVHLLTLVFGASLVGVAEDYGIHYFSSRQGQPGTAPRTLMRHLLPGMGLALVTSVLAYLALGVAPFPGLRQMAVFSASGLIAAFLTVALWFPWLDRGTPRSSGFARAIAGSLHAWPRFTGLKGAALVAALIAFAIVGLSRLQFDDNLRSLQNSPAELIAQQVQIGRVLGLPSPAQFFLVEGEDAEQMLRREESLTDRLARAAEAGRIAGHRAVSDWLPSMARQQENIGLSQAIERVVLQRAAAVLDEAFEPPLSLVVPMPPEAWLGQPIAVPMRPLWLGAVDGRHGSVVMVEGLGPDTDLDAMNALASGLDGVRWIDRTAQISTLLTYYRERISWLLGLGYLAVAGTLWLRYRRQAWRALVPTMLAAALSLAMLGYIGEPLQLFGVLAQLLLLGIGVDYGIFLLEHRDDPSSWLAINVGAASTLLAFGLLGLSATPALRSFGLMLLFGIGGVWLLSPCFRPAVESESARPSPGRLPP